MQTETVDCDLCGSARRDAAFSRTEGGLVSTVVRCPDCGLLYTAPRPVGQDLVAMYQATYLESPTQTKREAGRLRRLVVGSRLLRSFWHALAGQCLSAFAEKARGKVLDVGCGTGDLLAEVVTRGCEGYGVEFNPDSVARCNERGLKVTCGDLDAAPYPPGTFDTIVFWHALEHLPSPKHALKKAASLLRPGGRIFVYIPNADSYMAAWAGPDWFPWHLPFHFYHFTPKTLRRLAEESGLSATDLRTVTAEFSVCYSLHEVSLKKDRGLMRALAERRLYGCLPLRLFIIPFLRFLDLIMPGRGEFIFMELARK